MAQKPKIGKNFTSTNANLGCVLPQTAANWARELFKPSEDGESLVVFNEKNFFRFGLNILDLNIGQNTTNWSGTSLLIP